MAAHEYGLGCFGDGTGVYTPATTHEKQETKITTEIIRALKETFPDAFVCKIHGGGYQRAGLPDVYMMLRGKCLWIEVKRPGADTTALQKRTLELLSACGAYCATAISPECAVDVVRDVISC